MGTGLPWPSSGWDFTLQYSGYGLDPGWEAGIPLVIYI